jgi:hydroxyacylglutathione hydrolase
LQSTLGNERLFSPALKDRTQELFTDWLLGSLSDPPRYYAYLKKVNATGAPLRGATPLPAARNVDEFASLATERETVVIDTRGMEAWAAGHVQGALNLPANQIARRAGELDPSMPVVTYCGTGYRATVAASLLRRAGLEQAWAVPGSYRAWTAAGLEVAHDASDGAIQSAPQEVERTHQPGGIRR